MARGIKVMHYKALGYRRVTIFVKPEVYDKLVEYAVKHGMNISDAINKILDEYLNTCSQ